MYNKQANDVVILYPEINYTNEEMKEERKINLQFKVAIRKAIKKNRSKNFIDFNHAFLYKNKKRFFIFENDLLPL